MWSRYYIIVLFLLFSTSLYAKGASEGNLDRAIDNQADFLINNIPQNSIIAVVGISSGNENLSRYITEGLTSYIINNNINNIRVVERAAMPILQKEINFQYSGAVDDNFMVSLGKMVGANIVVAGTIYSINNDLRFNVRAIEIETSYVIASSGMDFTADNKVNSLLNGGTVKDTLSRDNIPVRENDGSVSRANQKLREQQRQTINNTISFFSKDFFDREFRIFMGYNYFPDFPLSIEGGYLANGLGFYMGLGLDPKSDNYKYSIGETQGIINFYMGLTYPLYFNWLWIAVGAEMFVVDTVTSITNHTSWIYYEREDELGFNPSIGIYLSFKRFYITAKYRYLLYGDNKSSFMLGGGICF